MRRDTTVAGNGRAGTHDLRSDLLAPCSLSGDGLRLLEVCLKKQWKRYCKELKRCQNKFSESAVHDSRVATRRLGSIAGLLGPFLTAKWEEKTQEALKRHLDIFDELRDTHVQLQRLAQLKRRFSAAVPFCKYLAKREQRLTRKTRRKIKRIKIRRLAKLIASARRQVKQRRRSCPIIEANLQITGLVHAAFERTAQLRTRITPQEVKSIHCTRIAFKKFRYMVETLAKQLPLATKRRLEAMHDYQTRMGEIQDARMLLLAFDKYLAKEPFDPKAARRLRAELGARQQRLVHNYLATADQLYEFWPAHQISVQRGGGVGPHRARAPRSRRRLS